MKRAAAATATTRMIRPLNLGWILSLWWIMASSWGSWNALASPTFSLDTTSSKDNGGYVPVEVYLGSWCSQQFPNQLGTNFTGYDMARLVHSHIAIEPYLGQYCFEQFPAELSELDRDKAFDDLQHRNTPIEPFLDHWSQRSLANLQPQQQSSSSSSFSLDSSNPIMVLVEPYIGEWCLLQFYQHLKHLQHTLFDKVAEQHVPLEPVLARWCFAQFPTQLQQLDTPYVMGHLQHHYYVPMEQVLMQWSMTLVSVDLYQKAQEQLEREKSGAPAYALSVLLIVLLVLLVCCMRRQWKVSSWFSEKETIDNNNNNKTELEAAATADEEDIILDDDHHPTVPRVS